MGVSSLLYSLQLGAVSVTTTVEDASELTGIVLAVLSEIAGVLPELPPQEARVEQTSNIRKTEGKAIMVPYVLVENDVS